MDNRIVPNTWWAVTQRDPSTYPNPIAVFAYKQHADAFMALQFPGTGIVYEWTGIIDNRQRGAGSDGP